jgi:hypothetical protein
MLRNNYLIIPWINVRILYGRNEELGNAKTSCATELPCSLKVEKLLSTSLHGEGPIYRSWQSLRWSRNSQTFIAPYRSLSCSQGRSTGPYPHSLLHSTHLSSAIYLIHTSVLSSHLRVGQQVSQAPPPFMFSDKNCAWIYGLPNAWYVPFPTHTPFNHNSIW